MRSPTTSIYSKELSLHITREFCCESPAPFLIKCACSGVDSLQSAGNLAMTNKARAGCLQVASAWHKKLAQVLICILYILLGPTTYRKERPLLPHTHKKSKALASDTTKRLAYIPWQATLVKVASLFGRPVLFVVLLQMVRRTRFSWRAESTDRISAVSRHRQCLRGSH